MNKLAVSDSTPLIYLARIGRLSVIRDVFEKVFIPEAVYYETVTQGKALNLSDASIIEKATGSWIIKEQIRPEVSNEYRFLDNNTKLGSGEKEALKLCKQLNAGYLIVDDREARRASRIMNIKPVGTCSVIVQACRKESITEREALQILDELVRSGFRIDLSLYRRITNELRQ